MIGEDCAGLPQVDLPSVSNEIECIGLIDDTLAFPRGIAMIGSNLIAVDKGSSLYEKGLKSGAVYLYRPHRTGFGRSLLISGLDNPSGVAVWGETQKFVFVSTRDQVLRFNPLATQPEDDVTVVIDHISTNGWHTITGLHIQGNSLYLSVPSATDHCESNDVHAIDVQFPCAEVDSQTPNEQQTAAIRRYQIDSEGRVSSEFQIIARGLRDALAVTTSVDGRSLYAADNGFDQISQVDPADEINLVSIPPTPNDQTSRPHFGWPYCFGARKVTPLYEDHIADCMAYTAPALLLPPHAAPLGLAMHRQSLWLNLHGFADSGRRTVRVALDADGIPVAITVRNDPLGLWSSHQLRHRSTIWYCIPGRYRLSDQR